MSSFANYPLNPDYGLGCYRRRIKLQQQANCVVAELEDCNHGFRCTVFHDGERITDIRSETLRIPFDTCPGAVVPLQKLIGLALFDDVTEILPEININENCTHLLDLCLLAVAHAKRNDGEYIYDIRVTDEQDEQAALSEISLNGKLVHSWQTKNWTIIGPDALRDRVLYKGFSQWAGQQFQGLEREAAFALQKGYFVASARRYDTDALAGGRATNEPVMMGVCHSYSSPQVEAASRLGHTTRDFSNTPEQLLKFT